MKSLVYMIAVIAALLFMPSKSYSEPIKINQYKVLDVPMICYNKEAFLEVVNAFTEEGRRAGLATNYVNLRMRTCFTRPEGYNFQPEKIVAELDKTNWTYKGVIFEGITQNAEGVWETMYAYVANNQLNNIHLGDDV